MTTMTRQRWTRLPAGGREGGGGVVGDVVVNIRRVVAMMVMTQRPLIQRAQKMVEVSQRQPSAAEILVAADVAVGGGGEGVSAWLDVREDGRWGARREKEEGGGEVVVVTAVSQALMAPKFDLSNDWQGRVEQQATDAPRRIALDRTQLIPLSEMPIYRARLSCPSSA